MQRIEVESTSLASIGYDPASRTLEVEFQSGAVYHYRDVPFPVAKALATAESVGSYFSRFVRPRYGYVRVE